MCERRHMYVWETPCVREEREAGSAHACLRTRREGLGGEGARNRGSQALAAVAVASLGDPGIAIAYWGIPCLGEFLLLCDSSPCL